eukprot:gene46476-56912_t
MRVLVIALLVAVLALVRASLPIKPSVSVTVKESTVQAKGFGFELPFKFAEGLFGFRYAVDLSNTKVTPDALFFRKSVQTGSDGVLKVEGDYEVGKSRLAASARW